MSDSIYRKLIAPITIFAGVIIVFLIRLKRLNVFLIEYYSNKSPIELLAYNDYEPLKFFGGAIILIILGLFLIYYYKQSISTLVLEFAEMIIAILSIVSIVILIILIIKNINIPIFQAILSLISLVGSIVATIGNN